MDADDEVVACTLLLGKGSRLGQCLCHVQTVPRDYLVKTCPLEFGSSKQCDSVPFQRGVHRVQPRKHSSKRYESSVATIESTVSVATSTKRGAYATGKHLGNSSTVFQGTRLDRNVCHLAVPVTKNVNCAVCQWATGNQYRAQVAHCEACDVNLCVWCNKTFHTEQDLGAKKDEICAEILARTVPKRNARKAAKRARKEARRHK